MESYAQFIERISSFEKPTPEFGEGDFSVNPGLKRKVDENNKFRAFYGDTTVFDLSAEVKARLNDIVDILYSEAGECFAERLKNSTFHVTLHDLSNSDNLSEIGEEVFRNELKLLKYVHSNKISKCTINFKTNYIVNMVGTSLVLCLKPKTKEDYDNLINLYGIVDCVKSLSYPMTPHITLAYYSSGGFSAESVQRLCKTVERLNENSFDITVSSDMLYYQKFKGMNSYHRIFTLTDSR